MDRVGQKSVCIIGHSGCGKTTILNILAGLDEASAGEVVMDGREVRGPSLDRGVVFQGHALMPWLTVRRNIAFAVKSRWPDWNRVQVDGHCQKYIDLVHLTGADVVRHRIVADIVAAYERADERAVDGGARA